MISREEKMKIIYEQAIKMLAEIKPDNIDMSKYFDIKKNFRTTNEVLYTMCISLQDRQGLPKIIGLLREDRKEIFKNILFNYDCKKILDNYTEESLLEAFSKHFMIGNINSKNNSWKLYAKSVISASSFMSTFDGIEDFERFVDRFNYNQHTSLALPVYLKETIFGMGFALACNFLKDLGYGEYSKPDVHIKDIFVGLNLCEDNEYSVFKAVKEMAKYVGASPAQVDKLLWIVCSGDFHLDGVKVGSKKSEFINRNKSL